MSSAVVMINYLFKNKKTIRLILNVCAVTVAALTVITRLLSGVHWLTDILGGLFLSAALVSLFVTAVSFVNERKKIYIKKRNDLCVSFLFCASRKPHAKCVVPKRLLPMSNPTAAAGSTCQGSWQNRKVLTEG